MPVNIEIKARCADPDGIRQWLLHNGAEYKGLDEQIDTYFHVPNGRLKVRQGAIENNLIWYQRPDLGGPKRSDFELVSLTDPAALLSLLEKALGIWMTVRKKREIYYIGNVKFHIDRVEQLGNFVEIEAGDLRVHKTVEELQTQCNYYMKIFGVTENDLIDRSYSDLLTTST